MFLKNKNIIFKIRKSKVTDYAALTECFSVHFKYFCKFSIKNITIWHFYSNFSTPAIFFEEMEPMFVIHNISIATDDDIIQFGNDENIYTVYLSRAIIIWENVLIG